MSDELEVWRWQFTDEFGKRVVSSWRMCAEQAARYKDAVRAPWTMEIRKPAPSMSHFSALAAHINAGNFFESPWQLSGSDSSTDERRRGGADPGGMVQASGL